MLYTISWLLIYFTHSSLCLLIPYPLSCPPRFLLPTGNHWLVLYVCDSVSVLLYSFICFIFFRFHIQLIHRVFVFLCLTYLLNTIPSRSSQTSVWILIQVSGHLFTKWRRARRGAGQVKQQVIPAAGPPVRWVGDRPPAALRLALRRARGLRDGPWERVRWSWAQRTTGARGHETLSGLLPHLGGRSCLPHHSRPSGGLLSKRKGL